VVNICDWRSNYQRGWHPITLFNPDILVPVTKTNNHLSPKESLNSDGQQFSTNINKTNNHLSPKESLSRR
jgi:hypothetical protein